MRSFLKITPVMLLAGLMLNGMNMLLAAPLSFTYAVIVAMVTERLAFTEVLEAGLANLRSLVLNLIILELAYAVAECFMATGVAASIINMALELGLSASGVAVVAFLVTCVLSVATGTSWGTFAACAPTFLWLNHIVGGDILLTLGAIAGGSCFGDNIGLISDTTIVSSGIQGVAVVHRVRHQGVWSLLCLATAALAFYVAGLSLASGSGVSVGAEAIAQIPDEIWTKLGEERKSAVTLLRQVQAGVPYLMVIPLIVVLGLAARGTHTLICLGGGIFASLVMGALCGTVTDLMSFLKLCSSGFSHAGGWVVATMLWVSPFGGVMKKMRAFDPIAALVLRVCTKVRHLMTCNALLCLFGNAALSDEMAQIVTISPMIKDLTEKNVEASKEDMYRLALRNATFADAMAVFGSQLIPWHVYMAYFLGISLSVYPIGADSITVFGIIKHNYMAWIAVGSMLALTFTGFDRFIPLFKLPSEPQVRLRKAEARAAEEQAVVEESTAA